MLHLQSMILIVPENHHSPNEMKSWSGSVPLGFGTVPAPKTGTDPILHDFFPRAHSGKTLVQSSAGRCGVLARQAKI